jgi:hypothetical protein
MYTHSRLAVSVWQFYRHFDRVEVNLSRLPSPGPASRSWRATITGYDDEGQGTDVYDCIRAPDASELEAIREVDQDVKENLYFLRYGRRREE